MKKSIISLGQRRFLIIWIAFHCTALFFNVAKIEGSLRNRGYSPVFNLFTTIDDTHYDEFYPFVRFVYTGKYSSIKGEYAYIYVNKSQDATNFFGVFTGYDVKAFFFYIVLGLAIIFLPKLWGTKASLDKAQTEKQ